MDEAAREKNAGFETLQADLLRLVERVIDYARARRH
jgi:hypothetical protein